MTGPSLRNRSGEEEEEEEEEEGRVVAPSPGLPMRAAEAKRRSPRIP